MGLFKPDCVLSYQLGQNVNIVASAGLAPRSGLRNSITITLLTQPFGRDPFFAGDDRQAGV